MDIFETDDPVLAASRLLNTPGIPSITKSIRVIQWLTTEVTNLRADMRKLTALERAVRAAAEHDEECGKDGTGGCCYRAWRPVALLVGVASVDTAEDRALLAAALCDVEDEDA